MKPFAHLHVHTEFSLLDGAVRTDKMFKLCDELGIPAVAMTDHGNLYGAIEFLKAAVKYTDKDADFFKFLAARKPFKVKPIIGCEVYMTDDMTAREKGKDGAPPKLNHLVLLCKNGTGYANLVKLVSESYIEGMYYKPRVDFERVKKYSEGLICLSACLAGVIPQAILKRDMAAADAWVKKFKAVFGDDFYIELQNHGIADQKYVLPRLIELAENNGVKTVATNDAHYLTKADAKMQKVLMAISFHSTLEDDEGSEQSYAETTLSDDKYFPTDEFYLKTFEEMEESLPGCTEAIERTIEIADKCDPYFIHRDQLLPSYTPPDGLTSEQFLRKLTFDGLKKRYPDMPAEVVERAEYELSVVENMKFVDYFLIVWDFIHHAETQGIPVGPGRGSGAGSIIAYAIGITKIDPLKYQLIFERFLNPERVSNPDFDVDFCVDRRGEVIDYVVEKYGKPNVSQIATFGTMATKAAIKDVGRVFNLPFADVNAITKMIPRGSEKLHIGQLLGHQPDKNGAIVAVPELKELYDTDPVARRVLDMAEKIEGMPRQIGMHAAGVIICRDPIADHVPLARTNEDVLVTQYDMIVDEELGLLKMDFLGLTTLTDIKKAIDNIKVTTGKDIDFFELGYEDQNVYELIGNGDTEAVFQLESGGMKGFMRELKPTKLEEIIAGISLYRPGPMDSIPDYIHNRHNPKSIVYDHPMLEPILSVTYGIIIYQEQVMQIARELAGYSMGGADNIRRMMSKKKTEAMNAEREVFVHGSDTVKGCVKNGIPAAIANEIYDKLIKFASYGFNKSHAAAYAHLTYQTAYLKRYYPVEFFTAILNNRITKLDELTHYLSYMKEAGIKVLPPNVNKSVAEYTVEDGCVRIGMGAIKGVGIPVINRIAEEREKGGEFKDFVDFISRMDDVEAGRNLLNKRMVEALIYAGAFDCFGKKRSVLIASFDRVMDMVSRERDAKMRGQVSFFDVMPQIKTEFTYPEMDEYPPNFKYKMEREVAGIYLSGHPLSAYVDKLKHFKYNTSMLNPESDDCPDSESKITLGGMLVSTVNKMTKKGSAMGTAVLEDLYGSIELVAFGKSYERLRPLWVKDTVVSVTGTVRVGDNGVSIWVDDITPFSASDANKSKVCCYFSLSDEQKLKELREIIAAYPGDDYIYVKNTDDGMLYRVSDKFSIETLSLGELCALFGEQYVKRN
ncbi:MAG: DNA polymerase III subunit alpha [Clostridiales bacterium]|nr:DNA polymerase III subunit alpha [Clostridiales bacterium]